MCHILEACANTGVSLLQFGDLYVEFGPSKEVSKPGLPDLTQYDHEKLNSEQVKRDVEELRELERSELILTDPLEHEERLFREATGEI